MYHKIAPTETLRERELALLKEAEDRRLTRRLCAGRASNARRRKAAVLGILAALVVASLLIMSAAGPAHADGEFIIKVNSTADLADASINGLCAADSALGDQCTVERRAEHGLEMSPGVLLQRSARPIHYRVPSPI